jgi:hypothetical protein
MEQFKETNEIHSKEKVPSNDLQGPIGPIQTKKKLRSEQTR